MSSSSHFGWGCMSVAPSTDWVHQFAPLQVNKLIPVAQHGDVVWCFDRESCITSTEHVDTLYTPPPPQPHPTPTPEWRVWAAEWHLSALSGWCLWKVQIAALQFCIGDSIRVKQKMEFKENLKTCDSSLTDHVSRAHFFISAMRDNV